MQIQCFQYVVFERARRGEKFFNEGESEGKGRGFLNRITREEVRIMAAHIRN